MATQHGTLVSTLGAALCALVLFLGTSAGAFPQYSLVWTGTTGSGTPGGSTIDALPGDILTLDVLVVVDAEGFTGALWDLMGTGGLTAMTNTLIGDLGAGGAAECPSPPNVAPGVCFVPPASSITPLDPGVTDSGSITSGYDVGTITPTFVVGDITVGRGFFEVDADADLVETVSTFFAPGLGGASDGGFNFGVPGVATATVLTPEPSTALLLAGGLALFGAARRRDSAA